IGIKLGDVVEGGDDLMGDAVNVAVRRESIAPVGGICVSASIYEQIVGKLTLGAEDMGEQHVKNIPRPVHAYRLTLQGATPIKPPTAKHPGRLVLAVGAVAAVVVLAGAGAWLLLERPQPLSPSVQTAQTPPTPPPVAAATLAKPAIPPPPGPAPQPPRPGPPTRPPSRIYSADAVPLGGDFRRPLLDNYPRAEDFKAMAINVRGIVAVAGGRVDAPPARRVALEECDRAV